MEKKSAKRKFAKSACAEAGNFSLVLRRRFDTLQAVFQRRRHDWPHTVEAMRRLQTALDLEFPAAARGVKRRLRLYEPRKHYQRALRLKKANTALREQLAKVTESKSKNSNFLSPEWLLRVFLSMPAVSARGMAHSFRDVVGSDFNTVSRTSIGKVRDVWVEMYKPMVLKVAADRAAVAIGAAKAARAIFVPLYLVLVQDEAEIRLRSREGLEGIAIPRRSRASKVQQNIVEMAFPAGSMNIPTELEALGDKTAGTLATCFERLLREITASVLPPPQPQADDQSQAADQPEKWLFNILVGDGIATNEAAAKLLWSCIKERGLGPGIRYFLLVIKCATHQVGLTAKSAVIGRAAEVAGGTLHEHIAGVCVRLYKYLICDYYDEFASAAHDYVSRFLEVLPHSEADPAATGAMARMQKMYTTHVIPDELVALWNNGLGRLCHVVRDGQNPLEERPRLVVAFVQFIVRFLLIVDSSPTLSRFFTFRSCGARMLTMYLLGIPEHVLQVRGVKPRKENQKRLIQKKNKSKRRRHNEDIL